LKAEQQPHRITRFPGLKILGVPYTYKHVTHLEKKQDFPQRVILGPNSVGWVTSEVSEWVETRIRARDLGRQRPDGGPPQNRPARASPAKTARPGRPR
jgi:predicted DNA-binding transcriptional regulator AlpA